ncbi:P-loop containing nucleoside triphosphate hydrolase protein [Aspergillus vadensis CBS 113365]|uniref:P-loop containing nucleoside triphosphate hydrolase protein n=1 Tax=Aspergillus vadensis (strain CBS 113365 / IMI 142717 / IBT 24658) TaxID=1448311 RepID=A0A319BN45_ASPVC|nr:P-loop containing nucleoside triphosphate hydrolase protein [Aspergillus vadensis CBS 113365]PYH73764.1 P-loop containing nucleoside triphosphate hydrolase protein [Aspergillus vadensis CBS 113365]
MLSSGFDLVKGFFKTGLRGSGQLIDTQQGPNNNNPSELQYESNEAERSTGSLGSTDEDQHSPQPTPSSTSLPTANKGTVRDQTSREAKPEIFDVFIGVMGMTGAGKSTFISLVTDQEVVIGNDLKACTQNVTMYRCKFSTSCNIWLIDTPGFDDTNRTDSEVLKEIAGWLAESFSQKVILNGILYLHRIMDNRMPGSAKRNLFMLKKLCGKDALRNTILVTTMWDLVDPADGDRREKQLITTPEYWGDMIAAGSQNLRHDNTYESAMRLINLYAGSHSTKEKKVLAIQHEMVIEKKALDETDAGKAVEDALIKERSRWRHSGLRPHCGSRSPYLIRSISRTCVGRSHQLGFRPHPVWRDQRQGIPAHVIPVCPDCDTPKRSEQRTSCRETPINDGDRQTVRSGFATSYAVQDGTEAWT